MCLYQILSKDKKDKILDKIPEKGITVYKVVRVIKGKCYSVYFMDMLPYEGTMKAKLPDWGLQANHQLAVYKAGFHFFKFKAAAKRLLKYRFSKEHACPGEKFKIIEATIKKEWITTIGTELKIDDNGYRDQVKRDIVFVTKKAIFAEEK